MTADILESVTRTTLLELFRTELGQPPVERDVDRTELYSRTRSSSAGAAGRSRPWSPIDRLPLGDGVQPGPMTRAIQACYFAVVRGEKPAYRHWLTPVYGR